MMNGNSIGRRLDQLEAMIVPPACPVCLGRPSRVVTIDPVTGREIDDNMPPSGCPLCGAPVFREYQIVVEVA